MKRTKWFSKVLLLALSVFSMSEMSAETKLTVEPFSIKAGETKELIIGVENPDMEVTSVQFDLRLPKGLTLAAEDDEYLVDFVDRTTLKKHSLELYYNSERSIYRFLMYSGKNNTITGTGGALITATIVADDSFTTGEISFETISIVAPNAETVCPDNFSINLVNATKDVLVTVNDATRKYGEANPELTYTVTPADVDLTGKVTLTCDADAKSEVGEYDITATAAEVEGMVITCVNGKLTVTPALLKVTANDVTRNEGEANPEFKLTYEGFVNGEDESVLTAKPTATTTATAGSVAGDYEITVSGGEANNYTFEYKSGTLTILAVDGIDAITADGRAQGDVYDLKGRKVRSAGTTMEGLPKGLYVIGGQKVIIK